MASEDILRNRDCVYTVLLLSGLINRDGETEGTCTLAA